MLIWYCLFVRTWNMTNTPVSILDFTNTHYRLKLKVKWKNLLELHELSHTQKLEGHLFWMNGTKLTDIWNSFLRTVGGVLLDITEQTRRMLNHMHNMSQSYICTIFLTPAAMKICLWISEHLCLKIWMLINKLF